MITLALGPLLKLKRCKESAIAPQTLPQVEALHADHNRVSGMSCCANPQLASFHLHTSNESSTDWLGSEEMPFSGRMLASGAILRILAMASRKAGS